MRELLTGRIPAFAKPASAGEGRSDKIMRPGSA
jgi:hypothetical protein